PNMPNATLAAQEEQGASQAETAGLSTVEDLRALSTEQVAQTFRAQTMIVDNYVIPEDPAIVFAQGRQHPVDLIAGANAAELSFGPRRAPPGASDGSDRIFWTAWRLAEYQRTLGKNAYVYWFTQTSPAPEGSDPYLPVHAAEVKYVFDNLGEQPLFPDASDPALAAASEADQRVADMVASYWVNFARSGNPNGPDLPEWPAHTGMDSVKAVILDADPASKSLPTLEQMQAHEERLQQQLAPLLQQR